MTTPAPSRTRPVVEVSHLRKAYGAVPAVNDVSFEVQAGEIFGVVGPNGAGKTTLLECLEGLRRADSGLVRVCGLDPISGHDALMPLIGVQLQSSLLPEHLRVGEALRLFASFYPRTTVDDLPKRLGLAGLERRPFRCLSGGEKQRLMVALALLHDPAVLFLDELTTGLDPQARHATWDLLRQLRERATKTIVLTSHYMEEAEILCDRVAIIDHGNLVALDTPTRLIRALGSGVRIQFSLEAPVDVEALKSIPGVKRLETVDNQVVVEVDDESVLTAIARHLDTCGAGLRNLSLGKPTLEDVFLRLTGRRIRE